MTEHRRIDVTRGARHQHDASVVGEAADRRARRVEHRVHILGHRAAPMLVRHVGESDVLDGPNARIADEEIEASERRTRAIDQLVRAGRPSRYPPRGRRRSPHTAAKYSRPTLGVGSRDCDSRSRRQRHIRRATAPCAADAARAARDERALSLQAIHRSRSTNSQMRCSMHRCSSCARSVRVVGMTTEWSASARSLPPSPGAERQHANPFRARRLGRAQHVGRIAARGVNDE